MYLQASFRDEKSVHEGDFTRQLLRVHPVISELSHNDSKLGGDWYLSGNGDGSQLGIPVFDGAEPRHAAIEELKRRSQDESGKPKSIDIWNGHSGRGNASNINIIIDCDVIANQFELSISEKGRGESRVGSYLAASNLLSKVAVEFNCGFVTFGPRPYFDNQVFKDRPGVSWMLYLPKTITAVEVPEARALIPVMREDAQQGTVIVSVTDGIFDVNNRAHVKAANDIEMRLVDQDLLPRYTDL